MPEEVETDVPHPALSVFLPFQGLQLSHRSKGEVESGGLCSSSLGGEGMTREIRSCYSGDSLYPGSLPARTTKEAHLLLFFFFFCEERSEGLSSL